MYFSNTQEFQATWQYFIQWHLASQYWIGTWESPFSYLPIGSKQFTSCIFKIWWFSSQIYVTVCSICFSWMLCSPPKHFVAIVKQIFPFYLVHSPITLGYVFHGGQQGFKSENVGQCMTRWWKNFLS